MDTAGAQGARPVVDEAKLIGFLLKRRRPDTAGIDDLVPDPLYDGHLAALIGMAVTTGCTTEDGPRRRAFARLACDWGGRDILAHTDRVAGPAAAVYCGAVPLAAYLGVYAVGAWCRTDARISIDEGLVALVDRLADTVWREGEQDAAWSTACALHRHLVAFGYSCRSRYTGLVQVSYVGIKRGSERLAAIGQLARFVTMNMTNTDHGAWIVRRALRSAPVPET